MKFKILGWAFDTTGFSYDRRNPRFISGRGEGHESEIVTEYERITQSLNARDLMRNSTIGRGIVRCIASSVIGSGIKLSAQSEDLDFNREIESAWTDWCYRPERTKTRSMKAVQRACMMHYISDGGVAIKLLSGGDIELIELERFRSPNDKTFGVPYELYGDGSIKGWYIADRLPGGGFTDAKLVKSESVITFFDYDRIDQIIPTSQLAACSKNLRDISETMDSAHKQVKDQTQIAIHHKRGTSGSPFPVGRGEKQSNTSDGLNEFAKASGFSVIDSDGEIKPVQAVAPGGQLVPFLQSSFQFVCMSIELPSAFVMKFFDSSYSASRSTLLQAHAKILEWQNDFCEEVMQQIYIWKASQLIADGIVEPPIDDSFLNVRWQLPAFEWIDQSDATATEIMEIKAGIRLLSDSAMKRGYQLEDLWRKKAQELKLRNDIAAEYGVSATELSDIVIPGAPQTVIKEVQ